MQKKVAVILINYKDYIDRFLAECRDSLRNQNYPSESYRVYIVDNASTKETREKVNSAIDFAKLFGSTIHVFSVLETNDEFHVSKLERQLQQVKSFITDAGIYCTGELIEETDDVPMSIIAYAAKKDCDLIVIMTQNETNFTDLFIGTAAQEVINNSEIPVLCIRPMVRKDLTQSVLS